MLTDYNFNDKIILLYYISSRNVTKTLIYYEFLIKYFVRNIVDLKILYNDILLIIVYSFDNI